MPNGNDITFDVNVNQNGYSKVVSMEETWGRLYGKDNLSEIESEMNLIVHHKLIIQNL